MRVPLVTPTTAASMLALLDHARSAESGDPLAYLHGFLAARSMGGQPDPTESGTPIGRVELVQRRVPR